MRSPATHTHRVPRTYSNTPEALLRASGRIAWYVAWTNPGCEKRARLALRAKGYEVFLPVRKRWETQFRRKVEVERALFPRYIFVALRPGQDFYRLRGAAGVESILKDSEGMPARVPGEAVDELRALQASGAWDETLKPPAPPPMPPGTPVQITAGPFQGFDAIVRTASSKTVEVLASIFGRETAVKLPLAAIRAA